MYNTVVYMYLCMIDCCLNCSLAVNVLTFVLGWYIYRTVCVWQQCVVYGSILGKMSALYRMLYGDHDCAIVHLLVAAVCPLEERLAEWVCLDRPQPPPYLASVSTHCTSFTRDQVNL